MNASTGLAPGSICLVTGASSGLGLAIAESLLQRGMKVIATARGQQRLQSAFDPSSHRVLTQVLDVTDGPAVSAFMDSLPEAWREVEVLIANAGSDVGGRQPFVEGDMQDWASTIETNVTGVMRMCHAVLPGMAERGHGHVVTIGSNAGLVTYSGGAAYSPSKFAVRAFTQCLRLEYRTSPIRITEILPGLVRTGFAEARHRGDSERAAEFYDSSHGALEAPDIAAAVMFALDQPPQVNIGQILVTPTGNK